MKIDRLIGILSILLQQEQTTAPVLAETFEVSRRTIARDIEALCQAGIPIVTRQGREGGISIMEGYRIDRTLLTEGDMKAILTGLTGLDSISDSGQYRRLMEKLSAGSTGRGGESAAMTQERDSDSSVEVRDIVAADGHMCIDLSSWYKSSLSPKIRLLQEAMEEGHCVEFTYTSPQGESHRRVEPAKLIFKWTSWYLWGRCQEKKAFRMFKLNRMTGLEMIDDLFYHESVPQPNLEPKQIFPRPMKTRIRFSSSVRWRLIEEFGADTFVEEEDGSLLFSFSFGDEENLFSWVLTFGREAEVLEPVWLRKRLLAEARALEKKYGCDGET